MTTWPSALWMGILLLAFSGCAAIRRDVAEREYIDNEVQNHVYLHPLEEVWPEAIYLLRETGYQVNQRASGTGRVMETDWKTDFLPGERGERTRYLVQGFRVDQESCRIEITHESEIFPTTREPRTRFGISAADAPTHEGGRDLEMEWKLLRRIEPQRAQLIKADAERTAREKVP